MHKDKGEKGLNKEIFISDILWQIFDKTKRLINKYMDLF